jgi:hypothetical protein
MAIFILLLEGKSSAEDMNAVKHCVSRDSRRVEQMDPLVSPRGSARKPYFIWLVVVLAHAGLIAAILLSRPPFSRELKKPSYSLSLLTLPNDSTTIAAPKITIRIDAAALHSNIDNHLPLPIPINNTAITLAPSERQQQRIDWDRESALAVEASIAKAAKEKSYHDLSGLTPEQLDWVKKNHMEPMPGFQWDRSSRGQMLRHGIIKLNDYCVLVVVIPFCRFGGKIQYNGDLFKDMHDPNLPDH